MLNTTDKNTLHDITLDDIRQYAIHQMFKLEMNHTDSDDSLIGFEQQGQFIINPWMDPSARFDITTKDAIDIYGKHNFDYFVSAVLERIADPSPALDELQMKIQEPIRQLVVLKGADGQIYNYIGVIADDMEYIIDTLEEARKKTISLYGSKWEVTDLMDNLPIEWNAQPFSPCVVYI